VSLVKPLTIGIDAANLHRGGLTHLMKLLGSAQRQVAQTGAIVQTDFGNECGAK
jgi:hypothetical protein